MKIEFKRISDTQWVSERFGSLSWTKRGNFFWTLGSRKGKVSFHCEFDLFGSDWITITVDKRGYPCRISNTTQEENAWVRVEDLGRGWRSLSRFLTAAGA